jgi:hypothetical protein
VWEGIVRKVRLFLVAASLAGASIVVSAPPASASCYGEPVDACAVVCQVGLSNKYTKDFFEFCYVL